MVNPTEALVNAAIRMHDLRHLLEAPASGTLKAWLQSRHGRMVNTVQANVSDDGTLYAGWAPGPREVDARSRAGGARLDGSLREYAGTKVEHTTATAIAFRTVNQVVIMWEDDEYAH